MVRFKAAAIAATELSDLNCFTVVFAEHGDGSGRRLEIQRALEFDDQDRALGQDTYCLCTEDGAVCYGGVRKWSLDGKRLLIDLDRTSVEKLGVDEGFEIDVNGDAPTLENVRFGLRRVFGELTN